MTEPSLLAWRRKALAAGDDREMAQTEELLRNCTEEEALRIAGWVSGRLRRTAFGLYACEAACLGVAASIVVPLSIRHPASLWPHHAVHAVLGLILASIIAVWFARSTAAKELRRSVDALRLVPFADARATLLSIGQPGCLQRLLAGDSELVALIEKDRTEANAPVVGPRVLNVWLRHIRREFPFSGPAHTVLFAETILQEAGRCSRSLLAFQIVEALAEKEPQNPEQERIVGAAKKAVDQMRPRFPNQE